MPLYGHKELQMMNWSKKSVAIPNHENKCSDKLKRVQRQATTLEDELKKKDEELAIVVEKLAATAEDQTLVIGKLPAAQTELDSSQGEVAELHRMAQGPVYQWAETKPPVAFSDPPVSYLSAEYANRPSKEDEEAGDCGAEVEDPKVEKEPDIEEKATRAEGEHQDKYRGDNPELGAQVAQRSSRVHALAKICCSMSKLYSCHSENISDNSFALALGHPELGARENEDCIFANKVLHGFVLKPTFSRTSLTSSSISCTSSMAALVLIVARGGNINNNELSLQLLGTSLNFECCSSQGPDRCGVVDLPMICLVNMMLPSFGPQSCEWSRGGGLLQGIVNFVSIAVQPWVWSDLNFLYPSLLLINKLFQVCSFLACAPFPHERGISTADYVSWDIPHGKWLSVVRLVSNLGEEFVNWFFENHVDALPHRPSRSSVLFFHFLIERSPQEDVPEACFSCLTSSSNQAYISAHIMRSRMSTRGLSVRRVELLQRAPFLQSRARKGLVPLEELLLWRRPGGPGFGPHQEDWGVVVRLGGTLCLLDATSFDVTLALSLSVIKMGLFAL
ncbi:hypothetical protein Acr_29g0012300 [Actinidia rufa]|uniref:Uncharacterized protein n=1 Tax=Actinidia rufa TaxID=165716 RepID=A0A7J0HG58_9ERIC|nr:hypothetical protein Acr_29g0012300 [Actinidia rufa]